MKTRIPAPLILAIALLSALAVITVLSRNINAQAFSRDAENGSSLFLPIILSGQQSAEPVFTELAADTALSGEQQDVLNAISSDSSTAQLLLVTANNSLLKTAQNIQLNIFRDVTLDVTTERVDIRSSNDFTWYGSNPSTRTYAIIVVKGSDAAGTVTNGGNLYKIMPVGDGVHANTEIDISRIDSDHPAEFAEIQRAASPQQNTFLNAQNVIRILAAFTPAARREVGNIEALIQLAVDETNLSFDNSGVNKSLQLVHLYETSYAETGNMSNDLGRFRVPNDGFMDEVHSLRNTYNADVVMLIGSRNYSYCGMASTILADYASAFALTAQNCATGYYTFPHELGHLLGARHNPEVDPATTPFVYGHGYYPPSQNWRTIMSYNCPSSCPRLPYWSNPNISYYGEQMGTAARHDNARVLNGGSSPTPTPTPTPSNAPDLIVTNLTITSLSSDSIAYQYTIKNTGTAPANLDGPTSVEWDNVKVQAYLSQDTIFNNAGDSPAGGTIIGLSPLGYLYPGETFTGSFSASANNPPGWNYLTLKVDWGEVVNESNETNNIIAASIP